MQKIEKTLRAAKHNRYSFRFILSLITWTIILLTGLPQLFNQNIQTVKQAGVLLILCLLGTLILIWEKYKNELLSIFKDVKNNFKENRSLAKALRLLRVEMNTFLDSFKTKCIGKKALIVKGFSLLFLTSMVVTSVFWFYDPNMNYQNLWVGFVVALFYVYLFLIGIWVITEIMVIKHQNKKDEIDDYAEKTTKNLATLNLTVTPLEADIIYYKFWTLHDNGNKMNQSAAYEEIENWLLNKLCYSKEEVKDKFNITLESDSFTRSARNNRPTSI